MKIVRDNIWLCVDCTVVAVNGDTSGIADETRLAAVEKGLLKLGPHLVPDFDMETGDGHQDFSWHGCDCCGSKLGGELHRFAVLGSESARSKRAVRKTPAARGGVRAGGLSIHRPLSGEERHAIQAWARAHGRRWKEALRDAWMSGDYRPYDEYDSVLQRIRNTRGPGWLVKFRLNA